MSGNSSCFVRREMIGNVIEPSSDWAVSGFGSEVGFFGIGLAGEGRFVLLGRRRMEPSELGGAGGSVGFLLGPTFVSGNVFERFLCGEAGDS